LSSTFPAATPLCVEKRTGAAGNISMEFAAHIKRALARWASVIRAANVRME
jgi:hypothetical protein